MQPIDSQLAVGRMQLLMSQSQQLCALSAAAFVLFFSPDYVIVCCLQLRPVYIKNPVNANRSHVEQYNL